MPCPKLLRQVFLKCTLIHGLSDCRAGYSTLLSVNIFLQSLTTILSTSEGKATDLTDSHLSNTFSLVCIENTACFLLQLIIQKIK